jgi:dTDP-4-dehydrorhamnose reductase
MRIAVTGKQGQVAQALAEIGPDRDVDVVLVGRPELDLQDASTVYDAISGVRPDIVVSAAAYTAVDKAESEPEAAFAVNAVGAEAVAEAAVRLGVPVIHLSTDYVFNGLLDRPYREDDEVGPTSVYGASKLEGERLVSAATPDHVILRTAWVYSPFGGNFVKTMLRVGETRAEVGVVSDQIGCPTSALDIAEAIVAAAAKLAADSSTNLRGVFHLTGSGQASWADFAEHVFKSAEAAGRAPVKVNRITTADYPMPARRPANSRLSGEKLEQYYGIRPPDWRRSADRVIRRLLSDV